MPEQDSLIMVENPDTGSVEVLEISSDYREPTEEELRHSLIAFYIFLFTVIFSQSALVHWRKLHRRSYELVTLIGLWLIPPIIAVFAGFWRFLTLWILFSSITGYFLYICTFSPTIDKKMPKLIYRWFFGVFKTSVGVGLAGYILLLVNIFLFAGVAPPLLDTTGLSIVAVWYGLYFGILTRDCAEVASDRIVNKLGGARRMAISVRDCAICGGELRDALTIPNGASSTLNSSSGGGGGGSGRDWSDGEASVQLDCKHLFHKDCLKGWLIVGKKDTCPTCSERVDLRQLYSDKPWETKNLQWIQMLDFFRYLVVWQPTILMALHFVLHALHLDGDQLHDDDDGPLVNGTGNLNGTGRAAGGGLIMGDSEGGMGAMKANAL